MTKTDKEKIKQLESDIKKMQNDNKRIIDDFDDVYYGNNRKIRPVINKLVIAIAIAAIVLCAAGAILLMITT